MKVKSLSHLRSLTALIRSNAKACYDLHEKCELWYMAVPSVTYMWTHRPQWRRRHKNRKKSNTLRFPISSPNSENNENDLLDTLKVIESSISRLSTSLPFDGFDGIRSSGREIVTEPESLANYDLQSNPESILSLVPNEESREFVRGDSVTASFNHSGVAKSTRETQMIRLIRSQKSLGVRNSAKSQVAFWDKFDSLEVNRSIEPSIEPSIEVQSRSDCSLRNRRVTFRNYISKNSFTDTRSFKSTRMSDDETTRGGSRWWQDSYARFTDDDDSLRTDLSRLFSSMIFDVSKSSLSMRSSRNSEGIEEPKARLTNGEGESIFYINSSYWRNSSCDLLTVEKIYSLDDVIERHKSASLTACDFGKKETECTALYATASRTVSNLQIFHDKKISRQRDTDHSGIERIIIRSKDVDFNDKAVSIDSASELVDKRRYSSSYKNHVSTDTNDLIARYHIPKLQPSILTLSRNDRDNAELKLIEMMMMDLPQCPRKQIGEIIFKQNSTVATRTFSNLSDERKRVGNLVKIGISKFNENLDRDHGTVDILRIETEAYGESESILIELRDLDVSFADGKLVKKSRSQGILTRVKKSTGLASPTFNLENERSKCPVGDEYCLICGRTKTNNPRYLRPPCRVKGASPTPLLENDPWINVMEKVMQHKNGKESMVQTKYPKDKDSLTSSKNSNSIHEIWPIGERTLGFIEKEEKKRFSVIITESDNALSSIPTDKSNASSLSEKSSSFPSKAGFSPSCLRYDFITSSRPLSGKSYHARESVRSLDVTVNRLLCVISESNALMDLPQLLPKKPADWFGRQVPNRKWP